MKNFFNPDNWLWRGFGRLADYFLLSAFWLLCCIPLVTIGSATIALYDTVAHCIRENEGNMFRRFFRTFKNELLRGCLLTVLWAVIACILNVGYQILTQYSDGTNAATVVSLVYFCSLFIPLGAICWCVALESRFSVPMGRLLKNSFLFTFAHLPQTFFIVAVFLVVLNVCINFPFLVIFLPGAAAHLQSPFIEKVLHKYMPQEGPESIEEAEDA